MDAVRPPATIPPATPGGLPEGPLPEISEAEQIVLELERRAAALQREQEFEPTVAVLTFQLGRQSFGLLLAQTRVVTRLLDVTPVPGTGPQVLGITNYKSALYPVVDLHAILNIEPPTPTRSARFIIVQRHDHALALLVDNIGEVRQVRESELQRKAGGPPGLATFIAAEIALEDRLCGLLNLDAVLFAVSEGEIKPDGVE